VRVDGACCSSVLGRLLRPSPALFPYATLFRSPEEPRIPHPEVFTLVQEHQPPQPLLEPERPPRHHDAPAEEAERRRAEVPRHPRSEEHTSELQSREKLVCRLLLEKKNPTSART